jgi:cysteine synthase A
MWLALAGAAFVMGLQLYQAKKEAKRPADLSLRGAVGNTPLVELTSLRELTGAHVYVKMELQNPSGSVKDRAASALMEEIEATYPDVEEIIEATAGNTGAALGSICKRKNLKLTLCIPESTSPIKVSLLRKLAGEGVLCPSVPSSGKKVKEQKKKKNGKANVCLQIRGTFTPQLGG